MSGGEKKNRIWKTEKDLTEKNVDVERERLVNFREKRLKLCWRLFCEELKKSYERTLMMNVSISERYHLFLFINVHGNDNYNCSENLVCLKIVD